VYIPIRKPIIMRYAKFLTTNLEIPTAVRHVFILVYNMKLIGDTRRRVNERITFRAER
jgi:hypothetical protein